MKLLNTLQLFCMLSVAVWASGCMQNTEVEEDPTSQAEYPLSADTTRTDSLAPEAVPLRKAPVITPGVYAVYFAEEGDSIDYSIKFPDREHFVNGAESFYQAFDEEMGCLLHEGKSRYRVTADSLIFNTTSHERVNCGDPWSEWADDRFFYKLTSVNEGEIRGTLVDYNDDAGDIRLSVVWKRMAL